MRVRDMKRLVGLVAVLGSEKAGWAGCVSGVSIGCMGGL